MTIRDRLDALYEEMPPHLIPQLDHVLNYTYRAPYDHAARTLSDELDKDEPDLNRCSALLDDMEWGLDRHFRPIATQSAAYRKDRKWYFHLMRGLLDAEHVDGLRKNIPFFFDIFSPGGKKKCGRLRSRCQYADGNKYGGTDKHCMHPYHNEDIHAVVCPSCGAARMCCSKTPKANGFCRFHGGKADDLNGDLPILRAEQAYGRVLTGDFARYFQEFREDPNFLSMLPELNLARAKLTERLAQLDEFDLSIVRRGIERSLAQARKALDRGDVQATYNALQQIEAYLHQASEGRRNDTEIDNSIVLIKQMAEAERKRIIDAQQMIPRQEAALIVEETIRDVYSLLEMLAGKNWDQIKESLYRHFPKESSRIINKLAETELKRRMSEMMAQEVSDALTRAQQEEYRNEMAEEQLALIEGEVVFDGEEAD